jgi:hypothetical protein
LGEASANPLSGYGNLTSCEQPLSPLFCPFSRNYSHHAGHLRIIIIHSKLYTAPHHRHITFLACASLAWLVAAPFLGLGLGCCSRLGAAKKPPTGLQRRLLVLVQYQYLCWGPCAAAYPRGSGTEILDHHSDHCHCYCHCHCHQNQTTNKTAVATASFPNGN